MDAERVLIDGVPADAVPVSDRGLHYGDGLFETLAVQAGRALALDLHLTRLGAGCAQLGIPVPERAILASEAAALAAALGRGVLKIIVTRGSGGRGYGPPVPATARRALLCYPWPQHPAHARTRGVRLRVCDTRLGRSPSLAGIKHLNRLEQVMARREWDDPEIAEGLMLDVDGWLVEGTMSNVFVAKNGVLGTPGLGGSGVAGIVRGAVLALSRAGRLPAVEVGHFGVEALAQADEIFVCSSVIGVWPVRSIDGCERVWETPGPVTRRVSTLLAAEGVIGDA